ncbi:hypothetical protein [Woodsholea maritima]|uniref:hypothetical protein n=1 Tax=Woodsholea maritima TaxID=240237 RepID=UPI0003717D4D|nr:hypothetical protein [Woodsholea maritima]
MEYIITILVAIPLLCLAMLPGMIALSRRIFNGRTVFILNILVCISAFWIEWAALLFWGALFLWALLGVKSQYDALRVCRPANPHVQPRDQRRSGGGGDWDIISPPISVESPSGGGDGGGGGGDG